MDNLWNLLLSLLQLFVNQFLQIPQLTKTTTTTTPIITFTSSFSSSITTNSTSTSTLELHNTSCPIGLFGDKCDTECGMTYFTQNQKIVGGSVAVAYSWPAQVYIKIQYNGSFYLPDSGVYVSQTLNAACGGTLIDQQTVLTASHCVLDTISFLYNYQDYSFPIKIDPSMYTVYLGLFNTTVISSGNISPAVRMTVKSAIRHPQYDNYNTLNDIAILKLSSPVKLSQQIQVACLPTKQSFSYPAPDQAAWIVGWGTTGWGQSVSASLRNVKITVYNNSSCQYVSPLQTKNWQTQICAGEWTGGKDTCQGDSGGPLYVIDTINGKTKYVLAGITSYGVGCADRESPSVYTRVSAYLDWIQMNK